jgi:hypothetical protein
MDNDGGRRESGDGEKDNDEGKCQEGTRKTLFVANLLPFLCRSAILKSLRQLGEAPVRIFTRPKRQHHGGQQRAVIDTRRG